VPHHLAAYVAGACKRRVRREHDDARAHDAWLYSALNEVDTLGQLAALGICSEGSLRLASGVEWEPPSLPPVLAQLAKTLEREITAEQRDILSWLGQHVSYTTIASWLGISRPAAVSRIQRLRARLIKTTLDFGTSLETAERVELLRFLHRAGVSESRLLALRHDGNPAKRGPR
jgi:hypothetical protein